ncbi:hypothetical protein [Pseudomonas palleroniana]
MESAQVQALIRQNSKVAKYIKAPRDNCFECAVEVAEVLSANNIQHYVVGMVMWSSFSQENNTHFVVSVYDLDDSPDNEPFIVDPTSGQFFDCQPLFKYYTLWRSELIDDTPLRQKLVKLKEYKFACRARAELNMFFGYPSEFDGGCLTAPNWYLKFHKNSALAEPFENPSFRSSEILAFPQTGLSNTVRNIFGRRNTYG